ncbi:Cytochrome P450 [Macleaya cordata]|uniref:Cytochrome P450 n=1 Tax=Macleaya cordata TaxID=56857 RepID=A0A200PYB3_MACCD|nr:Cytochrome P450 [Macleaya cordata]
METLIRSELMVWTASSVIATALLFLLLLRRRNAGRTTTTLRVPPGPPGWPVIGNIVDLGTKPHVNLARLKSKYGSLIWLRLGSINTLVISSAESAMEMFKNHDHSFCNRYLNETMRTDEAYTGTMVLGEYGPYWRMLRRLCTTELFSRKRINDTAPLRRRCVDKLIKWISDEANKETGNSVELARFVFAASFNVIAISCSLVSRSLVQRCTHGRDPCPVHM